MNAQQSRRVLVRWLSNSTEVSVGTGWPNRLRLLEIAAIVGATIQMCDSALAASARSVPRAESLWAAFKRSAFCASVPNTSCANL